MSEGAPEAELHPAGLQVILGEGAGVVVEVTPPGGVTTPEQQTAAEAEGEVVGPTAQAEVAVDEVVGGGEGREAEPEREGNGGEAVEGLSEGGEGQRPGAEAAEVGGERGAGAVQRVGSHGPASGGSSLLHAKAAPAINPAPSYPMLPRSCPHWAAAVHAVDSDLPPARFPYTKWGRSSSESASGMDGLHLLDPHRGPRGWRARRRRRHPCPAPAGRGTPTAPTTLVEFTLTPAGGGTELHITESGFEQLLEPRRHRAFLMNTGGWGAQTENLRRHVDGREAGNRPTLTPGGRARTLERARHSCALSPATRRKGW